MSAETTIHCDAMESGRVRIAIPGLGQLIVTTEGAESFVHALTAATQLAKRIKEVGFDRATAERSS